MPNALYYGDNLAVLRDRVADESVDLVYLDPPFNSNGSFNVLFREKTKEESPAQIQAFMDSWEWTSETEYAYEYEIIGNPTVPSAVKDIICGDPTASHYLKLLTDTVFEARNFRA